MATSISRHNEMKISDRIWKKGGGASMRIYVNYSFLLFLSSPALLLKSSTDTHSPAPPANSPAPAICIYIYRWDELNAEETVSPPTLSILHLASPSIEASMETSSSKDVAAAQVSSLSPWLFIFLVLFHLRNKTFLWEILFCFFVLKDETTVKM